MKNVHLTLILYVLYLVKIRHHISYLYALLEQHLLHQAWCEA